MREIKDPPSAPRRRRVRRQPLRISELRSDQDLSIHEHHASEFPAVRCFEASAHKPMSEMRPDKAVESIAQGSFNGGNARASEMMAFRILNTAANARLLASEHQVEYSKRCSCADMVLECGEERIGVSVTRVYNYRSNPVCFDSVRRLLERKLKSIEVAQSCVKPEWEWTRCSLFVWVARQQDLQLVLDAWEDFQGERQDPAVMFVCCAVDMPWIF